MAKITKNIQLCAIPTDFSKIGGYNAHFIGDQNVKDAKDFTAEVIDELGIVADVGAGAKIGVVEVSEYSAISDHGHTTVQFHLAQLRRQHLRLSLRRDETCLGRDHAPVSSCRASTTGDASS